MYVYELDDSRREKNKPNESGSSNSFARPRSNKRAEVDEAVAVQ